MASAKPCLGYPSRTAAIIAMRQRGMLTGEIARTIGIPTSTVTALEVSHGRATRQAKVAEAPGGIRMAKISDYFDFETVHALRPHAARRDMSVDRLMKEIVRNVAGGQLVDAVLDDGRGA